MTDEKFIQALGPSFMSQVRSINPKVQRLDLRKLLDNSAFDRAGEAISRERLPETVEADYPAMVKSSNPIANIDPAWQKKSVGIIGAGAAGLCAGYELYRSGIVPVFFEAQMEGNYARPGGRAYSHDFGPALEVSQKSPGDLGCMRFPATHTTLHAYVDQVFKGEYRYHGTPGTQWPTFIDPLLYKQQGDIPQDDWTVMYDTVIMARGVNKRSPYRVNSNATFGSINGAIKDSSIAFGELIFGTPGILKNIVNAYAAGDIDTIRTEWQKLNDTYQDKSIYEVLRNQGWDKEIHGDNNTSRLALFGELGIGSGGFDAFWGTTFMEVLRIKLHCDETDQSAFLGGASYMLKPFLTHPVKNSIHPQASMNDATKGQVVTSPVIRIDPLNGGGVVVSTEDGKTYKFPLVVLTASPTSISSSIMMDESLLAPKTWNNIRRIPLTDCGKIMVGFETPFWKRASKVHPNSDAIVTTVTDYDIRQIYTFDDYHWGSGSPAGVLMMSYTWGDWAHKMGSLRPETQVHSAMRMMKTIYASEWRDEWDGLFENAIAKNAYRAINWSHERGFAGGYRMADLNRYPEQMATWENNFVPSRSDAAVLLAGEAVAWLGLSGWVEGALHTGINATIGVGEWFKGYASSFPWDNMTNPSDIQGASFAVPADPGNTPFNPSQS